MAKKKVVKKAVKKATSQKKAQPKKANKKVIKKTVSKKKTVVKKNSVKKSTSKKTVKPKAVKKSAKVVTKAVASKPVIKAQPKKVNYAEAVSPLGDRIVVKAESDSSEKITAGGIIIPGTSNYEDGYVRAKVMAVGSGWKSKKGHIHPLDVKAGDTVLFSEYRAVKVRFNDEDLFILNESDVFGVVEK